MKNKDLSIALNSSPRKQAKQRTLSILMGIWCALGCCACSVQKQQTLPHRAELSRQLGFPVSRHDDLRLFAEAASWLGTPYRYGGNSRKGTDCSGLINRICQKVYGHALNRTVKEMAGSDCRKVAKNSLKSGDLVFFNTSKKKRGINHAGLFLKQGYFIHASTSKGVIISNLREPYYHTAYRQAGRIKK